MGIQMSTSELSSEGLSEMSDADESDDRHSDSSEDAENGENNDNLTYYQRRIIKQPSLNRVARMSSMESETSQPYESPPSSKQNQPPPLLKQQHQLPPSQRISSPLNADSATADVEAEKMKKLLEWELSALEADDLRSHAWYHGQQVDRTEAELLLRQCVAEEHGSATATIITANDTITPSNNVTATATTKGSSSLQHHVEEATSDLDGIYDVSSDSSDSDFSIDDCIDKRDMVPDPSLATRRRIDGVLPLKRPKRPHRPRRHFYCFLVRDSLNVRPPGRYVVSCLRVDKYEDLETGDKNIAQRYHDDDQRRKFQRKQQRRQRRQHRHPVLHFVVNEIILQPGTVYERSQFSFGETLPSMTTAISTAVANNNVGLINEQRQCQPGFDSVPDLIRYYVGGADDNAVLSYRGGNDGVVSGSMTLSRAAQTEVRIRYPCNRRRPLMTDKSLAEDASPNILPSTMENSRLVRQRCRTLTTASTRTEGLRVISTSPGRETEASTSAQNTNHRRHSPSPPPQISKWMRVQSSSRSSVRRTPSATVTSTMVTSGTSLQPPSAAESVNQTQSQLLTLSPCPPRIDPQSSITGSTSGSPDPSVTTLPRLSRSPQDPLKTFPSPFKPGIASTSTGSSIKTLPHQPKSSYPLPSTSGSSSLLSYDRPSTSGSKSNSDQSSFSPGRMPSYPGMPSGSTPHLTISDLLSSPSSSTDSSRLSRSISRTNLLSREFSDPRSSVFSITAMDTNEGVPTPGINIDSPGIPSSVRDRFDESAVDLFSMPFREAIRSSFFRIRVRNGLRCMLDRSMRPLHSRPVWSGSSDDRQSRSVSRRIRPKRRRVLTNSQNTSSSSENETDDEEQGLSSSSDSSSISSSTLRDLELEHNRGRNGQLVDRQKEESALEQPQQNEHQFTLKDEELEHNRGGNGQLVDWQKKESAVEQPQRNEHQFTLNDEELEHNRGGNGQLVDCQKKESAVEQPQQNEHQFTLKDEELERNIGENGQLVDWQKKESAVEQPQQNEHQFTLKDEELEHNIGGNGQLVDRQKEESAVEQPQQNKHQFTLKDEELERNIGGNGQLVDWQKKESAVEQPQRNEHQFTLNDEELEHNRGGNGQLVDCQKKESAVEQPQQNEHQFTLKDEELERNIGGNGQLVDCQKKENAVEQPQQNEHEFTLKDEELEHNRGGNGQLVDRQKEESALEQPQQNEHQFTDRQVVNSQRETQDEEVQEVENPMTNVKVRHKSVEEHTRLEGYVDQKQSDEQKTLDSDSKVENSSEAPENQNFQKCRTRWTNTMRQGLVDMLEQPQLNNQNRQLTRTTETQDCDPRQRSSRHIQQTLNEDQEVGHTTESMNTELHRSIPDTETRQLATLNNRTDQVATDSPAQTADTRSSTRLVNRNLDGDRIRQHYSLRTLNIEERSTRLRLAVIERHLEFFNRLLISENHQLPTGGDLPSAGKYIREHVIPPRETQFRVNQEGEGAPVTKADQSNTTAVVESSTDISGQEIGTCSVGVGSIGYKLACDYVNINPRIYNHNNSFDKSDTQHLNTNNLDRIHHKNYKHQGSKRQTYNSFVDDNIEVGADYENIISHNTDDTNDFNYENIGKKSDAKRQQQVNNFNGGSTAVAAALRAVHLAIIGDPDDTSGVSVGTGRLAAALCRADGRVTVLPYRRNFTKSEQVGPFLSTCPLQLLGQPGPAGRRARLDVIERFACLQYLVAMTVIVTPCLLLIGNDINDKENLEWSLEDEYEYRRRRFYYRCAGISSWCDSDNNSTSDDDDESYKLTAYSDFDSGYSLPPREEWAVEKRHWLDLLTKHRAAALDKWIRTAADAKQAVGDVYGYRALMSALCSDRIQALRDAWATLRRLHTATAVAFESRLRPEFLGRREKNVVAVGNPGINDIDDNDVNELLQLPPNATVPDATALAVLYEHLYNDNNSDTNSSINTTVAISNDIGSKKEKDPRLSSFFTSPLLLPPSPWSSLNSGISGGLGSSVASDYGLSALHVQCIQYSEWVQQSYGNDDSLLPLTKPPMLQLDRFRSNFRALLRQYNESGFDSYDDGDESLNCGLSFKNKNFQKDENTSYHEEFNYNQNDNFAYERQYEDNVEKYGTSGADYDECGDDDDDDNDDATVIYCTNNSSLSAVKSVAVDTMYVDSRVAATAAEKQRQTTTKNEQCHRLKQDQEEDQYYRWIEDVSANSPGPAPLNIVFCTELHVRLFWPPTLFLQNINDNKDTVDPKLAIPAYALGTTYMATEIAAYDNESESTNHAPSALALNHVITAQLDQAAQDMRLRYKEMDDFLDGACAYSTLVAKIAYEL